MEARFRGTHLAFFQRGNFVVSCKERADVGFEACSRSGEVKFSLRTRRPFKNSHVFNTGCLFWSKTVAGFAKNSKLETELKQQRPASAPKKKG